MTSDRPVKDSTLDPADWDDLRTLGHRMLDDMLDYVQQIRDRPVWREMPDEQRGTFRSALPSNPTDAASVYDEFTRTVVPYALGNVHPGFMGWVHGGGTPVGMLAEMLAAGLNSNLGGRDHAGIEVERQVVDWVRQIFEFPDTASGLFVTGTSMANLLAILVARRWALDQSCRTEGITARGSSLRAYTSRAAHSCIARAMDFAGFGSDALRVVDTDRQHRMNVSALRAAIETDRKAGLEPFLVIGSAGTVDIGGIDDLEAIAGICLDERLWFHVDGAFGALAKLSPDLAPRLAGIEQADSIAFDFHKWGQVPYDAGFLLVRDATHHMDAFASPAAYLRREARGLAAGSPWPCDLGPDLSRGFRALKTWFTLKTFGTERLGQSIARSCEVARYLEARILAEPKLELLAPAQLNIVCYRYRSEDPDAFNAALAVAIQESGIAAPSTTILGGKLAIRAAVVNHRTRENDVDALIDATLSLASRTATRALSA
ncbi:MAG TPA: aspartate aminotransferase family protein [Alphaproteobacteria bacterium]|nr:aspartate aminotransferase family protein [Alphaproteobacteria bacterium]